MSSQFGTFNSRRWPWQVTCPTCGAAAGWPCKDYVGVPLIGEHHSSRIDLAQR